VRSSPGHILSRGLSRSAVIAFLALALVLGGATREGGLGHGALQLLSVFILVWCAWDTRLQRMSAGARQGVMLAGAIAGLGLVQLLPLPPALWQNLPARDGVAQGFELVGAQTPEAMAREIEAALARR